jgi:ADP-ribosylglycohydrolase/catechol 2,3-dioxygenase-like lactoylglutathione lyase family enzyme
MVMSENNDLIKTKEKIRAALIGAAIGDALGWPQEMRGGRVGRRNAFSPALAFHPWQRRAGGRFFSHEERIGAGEYSDDTQLLLATARSVLKGSSWLRHFVQNELPTWLIYERGGGGATKRAAEAWVSGASPWADDGEGRRTAYFQAGGNGVAMRVMPHVLAMGSASDFKDIRESIFLNGITTHGHPRALIGAILYGFVCWNALRHSGTLPYGHLLEIASKQAEVWGSIPKCDTPDGWMSNSSERDEFESIWGRTVQEMQDLIGIGLQGIRSGALAIDQHILKQLGAVDSKVIGSGTVTAAAVAYLASRYAPDPRHGVVEAAFTKGADTDTIASMTGGLLGLIAGIDWLQNVARSVQDRECLQKAADELSSLPWTFPDLTELPRRRSTDIKQFWVTLRSASIGSAVTIPDGREGMVERVDAVEAKSSPIRGTLWNIRISDGQTLHPMKLERASRTKQAAIDFSVSDPKLERPFESSVQAVKIRVTDLERAHHFYGQVLGLRVVRQSKNAVNFGGSLTFVKSDYLGGDLPGTFMPSIVCVETHSLNQARSRLLEAGCSSLTNVENKGGLPFFSCRDFDGNVVEVFEHRRSAEQM